MHADSAAQQVLLQVQAQDTHMDQLTHRARTLPVLERIAAAEARLSDLASLLVAARTEVSDITREQARADTDVEQVRTRADRDRQRLDSGQINNPKELQALTQEIESLQRRQSELEDVELEVMERLEAAQGHLAELEAEEAAVQAALATDRADRDAQLAALGQESAAARAEREALVPQLPEDLVALYEKLRGTLGGVGAAELHQGRCEGCRLQINATELERLRAAEADEVLRCEECRRILVRTPRSGL